MYTGTAELYDAIYAFKDYRTEAQQLATSATRWTVSVNT
jgi:hypothetical protein